MGSIEKENSGELNTVLTFNTDKVDSLNNSNKKEYEVGFVITGFGPFKNVPLNPSQMLIEMIEENKSQLQFELQQEFNSVLVQNIIFKTCAKSVESELFKIHSELDIKGSSNNDEYVCKNLIYIHIGVHNASNKFNLEKQAYNEADFGCADESGFQPRKCAIESTNEKCRKGSILRTDLDLVTLSKSLSSNGVQFPVQISSDPGRFVCNYTYYKSLSYSNQLRRQISVNSPQIHVLFLHIPPIHSIPITQQYHFLKTLLQHLILLVTPQTSSKLHTLSYA